MLRASYEAAVARDDPSRPSLGVPFWWWVQLLVRSEEGMGSFWGRMERSLEGHGEGGFCGVFVCVRASMASAGRAFNLSGQPDGEQRPAVSSRVRARSSWAQVLVERRSRAGGE